MNTKKMKELKDSLELEEFDNEVLRHYLSQYRVALVIVFIFSVSVACATILQLSWR